MSYLSYWNPILSSKDNSFEGYLKLDRKSRNQAKHFGKAYGKVMESHNKDMGKRMERHHRDMQRSMKRQTAEFTAALDSGFSNMSNVLTVGFSNLHWKQQETNALLTEVIDGLKIADEEKTRWKSIEDGMQWFQKSQKNDKFFEYALKEFLKAYEIEQTDILVNYHIGLIYFASPMVNIEKAIEFFEEALLFTECISKNDDEDIIQRVNFLTRSAANLSMYSTKNIKRLYSDISMRISQCHLIQSNYKESISHIKNSLKNKKYLEVDNATGYTIWHAKCLAEDNNLKSSVKILDKVLMKEPRHEGMILKDPSFNKKEILHYIDTTLPDQLDENAKNIIDLMKSKWPACLKTSYLRELNNIESNKMYNVIIDDFQKEYDSGDRISHKDIEKEFKNKTYDVSFIRYDTIDDKIKAKILDRILFDLGKQNPDLLELDFESFKLKEDLEKTVLVNKSINKAIHKLLATRKKLKSKLKTLSDKKYSVEYTNKRSILTKHAYDWSISKIEETPEYQNVVQDIVNVKNQLKRLKQEEKVLKDELRKEINPVFPYLTNLIKLKTLDKLILDNYIEDYIQPKSILNKELTLEVITSDLIPEINKNKKVISKNSISLIDYIDTYINKFTI